MAEITQAGAPGKHTIGKIDDIYTDSITGRQYICVGIYHASTYHGQETTYEWDEIDTSGGSGGSSDGHTHSNKGVLDRLNQNSAGNLTFGGSEIKGGAGEPGEDGITPHIGANGNWFIGDTDTGVAAAGKDGKDGAQGIQGPQGESAVSAINPRGDYSASADPAYSVSDYITYTDGNTYVCKADNPSNTAPIDGTSADSYWQLIALRGATGPQGNPGVDGKDGVDGVNGAAGKDGADGVGISKIDKISTEGLVDTYQITFSDGTTFDYTVTNGADGAAGESGSGESITISEEAGNAIESKEDGIYVADKSAEIAQIQNDLAPITKYQKYVNTELGYCHIARVLDDPTQGVVVTSSSATSALIPLLSNNVDSNLEITEDGYVKLLGGHQYLVTAEVLIQAGGATLMIKDSSGKNYSSCGYSVGSPGPGVTASAYVAPEEDLLIALFFKESGVNWYTHHAYFTIQEINRAITIDPLNYVNEKQGIEDAPVGHIISYMGNNAPDHYIPCDGTEYNIADYPYLAQHMIDQFGSVNHFGGDGATTFAVPDLRGEFLRGTGTALRNTGTGGVVGEHQDGTEHLAVVNYPTINNFITPDSTSFHITNNNADTFTAASAGDVYAAKTSGHTEVTTTGTYTSRPTNTAVLYCIKYEPTYFMVHKDYNTNYLQPTLYSEEERVVGCWIDGKPLYEKTLYTTVPAASTVTHIDISALQLDTCVNISFTTKLPNDSSIQVTGSADFINANQTTYGIGFYIRGTDLECIASSAFITTATSMYITIQYTKTTDAEGSFSTQMITDYAVAGYNNTVFPDYTNELAKITTAGATYTATENCVVVGGMTGSSSAEANVYVDGVSATKISSTNGYISTGVFFYVKAGQVLTTNSQGSYALTIYGLQS